MDAPRESDAESRTGMDLLTNGMRRSGRAKKMPARYDNEITTPSLSLATTRQSTTTQIRPKRKAAIAAAEEISYDTAVPSLEGFLSRVSPEERKEYRGWVELESEPAFFNEMLRELGADDFKVQEVFGLDEFTLDDLPKPVHGLVFLYQYTDADESSDDRQDCPENLWFGNQTTANACATVALMNILMNAKDVEFGPELQQFKEATLLLPPPHRGHALDTNDFIRVIHNSVARRTDLVSEDLLLDNKFELAEKRRKMSLLKKKVTNRRATRKKADRETSYHYIAYVPVDGQVWELDGFETKPLCLGPYADPNTPTTNPSSWLSIASRAIHTRMLRDNDEDSDSEYLSFNLLALCQAPLTALRRELSTSLLCSYHLFATYTTPSSSILIPNPFDTFTPSRLAKLGGRLSRETILFPPSSSSSPSSPPQSPTHLKPKRPLPPTFVSLLSTLSPTFPSQAIVDLSSRLRSDQESLEARIRAALLDNDDDDDNRGNDVMRGRRRDYTPAVHEWVRVLAHKEPGLLRELLEEVGRES